MRRRAAIIIFALLFFALNSSEACVGRVINIGAVDSDYDVFFSTLISVLIEERTGTTVNVLRFRNHEEVYKALDRDEVNLVIDNTLHAFSKLGIRKADIEGDDYEISKEEYRERFGLIWLKPMASISEDGVQRSYSAVITEDVLINFPALPRVVNKLRNISLDRRFSSALESFRSGLDAESAARDLLKKKKLI